MIQEPEKRISRQALTVWRISGTIQVAIVWVVAAVVMFLVHFFHWSGWISSVVIILGVANTFLSIWFFPSLKWRRWRYEVREEEIDLQHGSIFRTRTLIPMVRVQHVDTVQGPLLRKYRLASVVVHTAATAHEIPALPEEEAEELRLFISKLARVADDDV